MPRPMKNSGVEWLGEIPADWKICPALYAFSEIRKKNTDGAVTNALKFYNGMIIRKTNFDAESDDYVADTITNYTVVNPDTIMINGLNLNYDLKSLRVGLVKEIGVITSAYLALCPDKSRIIPKYATYLFKGYEAKMAFHNMGAGIRKTLGFKEFRRQPILVPPLDEQQRIATFLDGECARIDSVIEKTRASIVEYKKLKQAIITRAVTKGIRPARTMKDSGVEWLGEIPTDWDAVNIRRLFSFGKGLPITKENLIESGLSVISYGQIHSKFNSGITVKPELIRFVDNDYLQRNPESIVKKGDFIFADTSEDLTGCGNCVYIDIDELIFAGYHTIILRSHREFHNKYFAFLFQSDVWRKQIRERVTGVKLFSISQKILRATSILVPPMEEQKEIAQYLDEKTAAIDLLVEKKEQLLTELERLKKSLIFEYVTGKKAVAQ